MTNRRSHLLKIVIKPRRSRFCIKRGFDAFLWVHLSKKGILKQVKTFDAKRRLLIKVLLIFKIKSFKWACGKAHQTQKRIRGSTQIIWINQENVWRVNVKCSKIDFKLLQITEHFWVTYWSICSNSSKKLSRKNQHHQSLQKYRTQKWKSEQGSSKFIINYSIYKL